MTSMANGIIAILISALMQLGITSSVEVEPQYAAEEFLDALKAADHQTMVKYVDNKYVNFLENADDAEETSDSMYQAFFENMTYEVSAETAKNDVAVVKVNLQTNDFSDIDKKYQQESYKFVTGNLYSDEVTDKKKLAAKCLEIYLGELKKVSKEKPDKQTTIYLPLVKDDHYGWTVVVRDDNMKAILGGIDLPESEK